MSVLLPITAFKRYGPLFSPPDKVIRELTHLWFCSYSTNLGDTSPVKFHVTANRVIGRSRRYRPCWYTLNLELVNRASIRLIFKTWFTPLSSAADLLTMMNSCLECLKRFYTLSGVYQHVEASASCFYLITYPHCLAKMLNKVEKMVDRY